MKHLYTIGVILAFIGFFELSSMVCKIIGKWIGKMWNKLPPFPRLKKVIENIWFLILWILGLVIILGFVFVFVQILYEIYMGIYKSF